MKGMVGLPNQKLSPLIYKKSASRKFLHQNIKASWSLSSAAEFAANKASL